MTEESIVDDETPPGAQDSGDPPPPPTGDPVGRPPLRRSRTDRVIAGVAGGIGSYFGVDPILVRIAFVVLAVFGGSGVILYLIAWLVIAEEGEADSAAVRALRGQEQRTGRGIAAVILLIAGVLLIGGPAVWATGVFFGEGLVIPLLLIAAGVALLVWPDEPFERSEVRNDLATARDEVTQAFTEVRDGISEAWGSPGTDTDASSSTPTPPPPPAPPLLPAPPVPPRAPRPRPLLGPLTLAVLLVFTGGAVALDRADLVDVDPAVGLAIALVIVGVALTVTAFVGRARGLIAVGILLLPFVWWFHAIDLTWWEGIGDERATVERLADLDDEYRFGIGRYIVDLSSLDLDGGEAEVAVGLTVGELIVCVPDDFQVVVDADGRIGEVALEGAGTDTVDDGFEPALDERIGDPEGGVLTLDLDIGIGSAKVQTRTGTEVVRCA